MYDKDKYIPLIKEQLEKADDGVTVYFCIDDDGKLLTVKKSASVTLDVTKMPDSIDKTWSVIYNEYDDMDVDEWSREIFNKIVSDNLDE